MKLLRTLWIPILVVFAFLIFVVIGIPLIAWHVLSNLWFRTRHHGKWFLVYTRRHGWNEFVINNLIPSVKHRAMPIQIPRGRRDRWPRVASLIHQATSGHQKPLIAKVYWWGVNAETIHALLIPLKKHGARNANVQHQLRELVENKISGNGARH
jgi:hypothetical protein